MFLLVSVILSTWGVSASVHAGIPPRADTPPGSRHPPRTVNERPVRILLECILVMWVVTRIPHKLFDLTRNKEICTSEFRVLTVQDLVLGHSYCCMDCMLTVNKGINWILVLILLLVWLFWVCTSRGILWCVFGFNYNTTYICCHNVLLAIFELPV